MDWKAIGNLVAFVGLLVAMGVMFNQVNARFDEMFDRQDRIPAETNARFDDVLDAIMSFDRRVSHLEGRLDAQSAE